MKCDSTINKSPYNERIEQEQNPSPSSKKATFCGISVDNTEVNVFTKELPPLPEKDVKNSHQQDICLQSPSTILPTTYVSTSSKSKPDSARIPDEKGSCSSENRMDKGRSADLNTTGKKINRAKNLCLPTSRPRKRSRLNTRSLSFTSQEIRTFSKGDKNSDLSAYIQLLDLNPDHYQFQSPAGSGHRLVRIVTIREGDNFLPYYVIKITNTSYKDLMAKYHDDLTLVTFNQAFTDYKACSSFMKHVEKQLPDKVITPKTRVACITYQDINTIYGEALSNNPEYNFLSNCKKNNNNLFIFIIIQEYIEMTSFTEADILQHENVINFFNGQIKDSGKESITSESANLKIDTKTKKPVFFDIEHDQILDFKIISDHSVELSNNCEKNLLNHQFFSQAFDNMPKLTYKKIESTRQEKLRSSLDKISLSEPTTTCIAPVDDEYTSDTDVFINT